MAAAKKIQKYDIVFCDSCLREPEPLSDTDVFAILDASSYGFDDIRLTTFFNQETLDKAPVIAAIDGNTEGIRQLLAVADPKYKNSKALREASKNGHAECVKLPIPGSDPKVLNCFALSLAARWGHIEYVELLLPVSDPKADKSCSLAWAIIMALLSFAAQVIVL